MVRHKLKESGFSLIEMVIVIVVLGIVAAVAIQSSSVSVDSVRRTNTERKMDALANAIVGNPALMQDGVRSDFGYVGDVGAFPTSLSALYTNPGLSTWNGPYIHPPFTQDTISYRTDDWGKAFTYGGGLTITSPGGSGPQIVKKIAESVGDYLLNRVTGTIKDKIDSLPGTIYKDSIEIKVDVPSGASGLITKTYKPDAAGAFAVDSIPAGQRYFRFIYKPAADTVRRYWTVLPRHQNNPALDVRLPDIFGTSSTTAATLVVRPTGSGSTISLLPWGSLSNWQDVDETTPDDGSTYVWSLIGGFNNDTYATQDHGAATGTIDSVIITIRVIKAGLSSGRTAHTLLVTHGSTYSGADISLDAVSSFTTYSTRYTVNPSTGAAWTWAEIDAMEVGVGLKAWCECTQVYATIYYRY